MDYNLKDLKGRKLVHYAAACQGSGPLEYLLEQGQNLHDVDNNKNTALMVAC